MDKKQAWKLVRDEEKELERLRQMRTKQTSQDFIDSYTVKIQQQETVVFLAQKKARSIK